MRRRLAVLGAAALAALVLMGSKAEAGEGTLRIVTFGTSLTERGGWQKPLGEALGACLRRPVAVETVALSGSTSEWGLAHVDEVAARAPDVVLVEFYANDAALNRPISLSGSRRNIEEILRRLRAALPNARIFGMGMNPIHGWRGWARPFLGRYVAAHRAAAETLADGYIDFAPAWSRLSPQEIEAAIPDGSHPRADVASAIVVPELLRRLASSCVSPAAK